MTGPQPEHLIGAQAVAGALASDVQWALCGSRGWGLWEPQAWRMGGALSPRSSPDTRDILSWDSPSRKINSGELAMVDNSRQIQSLGALVISGYHVTSVFSFGGGNETLDLRVL